MRGVVGADVPDRVDLEQARHEADDTDGDGEERAALRRERRQDADADDVVLGAAGPGGELGVLLVPDQADVHGDERQQDARDDQHVRDVEARDDLGAGKLAAEQQPLQPGADDRRGHRDAGHDPQAGARQQVVGGASSR